MSNSNSGKGRNPSRKTSGNYSGKKGSPGRGTSRTSDSASGKPTKSGRSRKDISGKRPVSKAGSSKSGSYNKGSYGSSKPGSQDTRQRHVSRPQGSGRESSRQETGKIRLNKFIANAGVCSRREADVLIAAGNVTVNGKVISEMGYKVDPSDEVRFDGRLLQRDKKVYVLLNKPKNFVTTTRDEKGRRTVTELITRASDSKLTPVGQLDRYTTGLLLFTNDEELRKKLTHPKHGVRKIYHVELDTNLKAGDLTAIRNGLELEDGRIEVDEVSYVEGVSRREVGVQLHSGRNRVVRQIFEHLGYKIVKLDRVVLAGLTKKDLPRGHWRHLTPQEVINLRMIS